jgi:hypothetical protein
MVLNEMYTNARFIYFCLGPDLCLEILTLRKAVGTINIDTSTFVKTMDDGCTFSFCTLLIIKMDLREIGIDGANWIQLAQDRVQWRACVNTVMNLRVP